MNTILKILSFSFAVTFINFSFGQATAFPAPIALAASWDTSLVYKVGKAIALEARDKGRNVLLAPCVNILRHPLERSNFKTYGEDPYLARQIADAFIKGVQSEPVISGVKSGAIDVYVIDDKVRPLLRAGFDTGLFDKDTTDTKDTLNVEAHNQLALQAARESIVLLKNYGG
ncbi:MAG: glycoside hydrolase family 3 N-terminal domain-containing protein, partial [Bacteroidota bacterium]|nr:glycoside hydrolase family 3 N-terminal domain-containing protein [Bacteroidota bacterium]